MSHSNPLFLGRLTVALGLVLALPSQAVADTATVYECHQPNGTVVFSGKPCGPDARQRVIQAPSAGSGSEAAWQGINDLAKQYDERQAREQAQAAQARRHEQEPPSAPPPTEPLVVPGYLPYPWVGPYPRRPHDHHRHDHDRDRTRIPYKLPEPGITGRFPGGPPNPRVP